MDLCGGVQQPPDGTDDGFWAMFGLYVLQPQVFEYLDDLVSSNIRTKGVFPLTPCLERLRAESGLQAHVVKGTRFDIGKDPAGYIRAMTQFASSAAPAAVTAAAHS